MPKEINQLSVDVKVLMISFPRLSCLCFVLTARNNSGEEVHDKMAAIFLSSLQMECSNSGDCSLHDFKHEGLAKITTVQ